MSVISNQSPLPGKFYIKLRPLLLYSKTSIVLHNDSQDGKFSWFYPAINLSWLQATTSQDASTH